MNRFLLSLMIAWCMSTLTMEQTASSESLQEQPPILTLIQLTQRVIAYENESYCPFDDEIGYMYVGGLTTHQSAYCYPFIKQATGGKMIKLISSEDIDETYRVAEKSDIECLIECMQEGQGRFSHLDQQSSIELLQAFIKK